MAKYLEDGVYAAVGMAASVYKNDKGNVILCTEWAIPSQNNKSIRNWDCLVIGNTGEIREKALTNIRKWATGWDGTTFSWFPQNLPGLEVSLVIENQPRNPPEFDENGNPVTASRVKWINPVGGGSGASAIVEDESATLDRMFGAKLRALSGARPVPSAPKPAPKPAPKASPKAAPKRTPVETTATPDEVTEMFYGLCDAANVEDRDAKWAELVQGAGLAADCAAWAPEEWGKMKDALEAWGGMPF